MNKIVVLKGSPRKNGFSTRLLRQVVAGARDMGAEITEYDLNDPAIRGCQGCFYCRSHEGCATEDALQPMYQDIREADGIAVSFPLYFGGINGQCKCWFDRMYPMLDENFQPRYPGKKAVTVFAQGNADPRRFQDTIDQTNMFFKIFGWEVQDTLLAFDTHNPHFTLSDELMESAYEAGKKFV